MAEGQSCTGRVHRSLAFMIARWSTFPTASGVGYGRSQALEEAQQVQTPLGASRATLLPIPAGLHEEPGLAVIRMPPPPRPHIQTVGQAQSALGGEGVPPSLLSMQGILNASAHDNPEGFSDDRD